MGIRRLFRSWRGLVLALVADFLLFGGPRLPAPRWPVGPWQAYHASFDAALAAQAKANQEWLDLDEVVGTAIGTNAAGVLVVKVYLTLPGALALPASIDAVPVEAVVTGRLTALSDLPLEAAAGREGDGIDPKKSFPRPVPIGVSTGHPDVTAGTIGARVTDGQRVYALSNNHVYANRNQGRRGDKLLQPGVHDGGKAPDDVIGTLHDFEPIRFCTGNQCPMNRMDAAIALTSPEDLGHATPEGGYGSPRGWAADASLGMEVQKYGRTTGHTRGRVTGIHATLDVDYRTGRARFENQIMVTGEFSNPGDSGSLIVTRGTLLGDRRPVGLLFAGSPTATVANPIGPVLDRFRVKVDGGEG